MKNRIKFFLTIPFLLFIVQYYSFYHLLPQEIAVHFNISGNPDRWSDKSTAFITHFVILSAMTFLFLGISYLIGKMSDSLINLPNKHYWLNSENREKSINYLKNTIATMGILTNLFIVYFNQLSIKANLDQTAIPIFHSLAGMIGLFLFLGILIFRLYSKFNNIPESENR